MVIGLTALIAITMTFSAANQIAARMISKI